MDDNTVIHLASQALVLIAELAGPVLVVSLAVGLVVALFQAVTSIQEFTLTFLPKVVAIGIVLLVLGHWMLGSTVAYTEHLYNSIPHVLKGRRVTFHLSASFAVALTLAFVRSVAWVTICPPFSNSSIPKMVKIGFAGAVAFFAAGTLQHDPLPQTDAQVLTADGGPGRRRA